MTDRYIIQARAVRDSRGVQHREILVGELKDAVEKAALLSSRLREPVDVIMAGRDNTDRILGGRPTPEVTIVPPIGDIFAAGDLLFRMAKTLSGALDELHEVSFPETSRAIRDILLALPAVQKKIEAATFVAGKES